jgi:hypothetical protein
VVFGKVVEGMMVVKRMEMCGTRSGKPSRKVVIIDCGELPSRMQALIKLKKEKDEAAACKESAAIDLDDSSLQRLKAIKEAAQTSQQAPKILDQVSADRQEPLHRAGPGPGTESDEDKPGGVEGADPYEGLSARQRKLMELRGKLQVCRKANQNAVIAEKKRQRVRWQCNNKIIWERVYFFWPETTYNRGLVHLKE